MESRLRPHRRATWSARRSRYRRTTYLAFLLLPWAQDAPGSNPGAPTNLCFFPPLRDTCIFVEALVNFLAGRRSVFTNHSISMTSPYREQARIQEGGRAIQKLLN